MKRLLLLLVIALGLGNAWADDFDDRVEKALAAGSPEQVIEALEKERYQGNLKASLQLGIFYREGKHVAKDPEKAFQLFEEAAEENWIRYRYKMGLDQAQYLLGMMLLKGEGQPADVEDAAEFFTRAANQGNALAQLELAKLYANGAGVNRDQEKALFWSKIAVDWLSDDAKKKEAEAIRDAVEKALSADQKEKVQRELDGWTARSV
jgi:TPR repeat protein